MKTDLMKASKLGEFLSIGAVFEEKEAAQAEIGLFLASKDISASCAFLIEEWELFVVAVGHIDRRLKVRLDKLRFEDRI